MNEKPTYTIRQNTRWIAAHIWRHDKLMIFNILWIAISGVAIAFLGILMPAAVVARITAGETFAALAFTVMGFTGGLTILHVSRSLMNWHRGIRRTILRSLKNYDMLVKSINTDFMNLERKDYKDKHTKALDQVNGNDTSTEQIYVTLENLLQNILGFMVYMALLAAVNPLIMAVTVVTALVGAIAREWVNRWEYAKEDERVQMRKRMWFIAGACESKYAKDIRLFGMVHWLQDVYESAIQLGYNFSRRLYLRHFAADTITAIAAFAREGFAYIILIFMVLDGAMAVDEFILLFAAVAGFNAWVGGILTEFSRLSRDSKNLCHVRNYLDYPESFRREGGVAIPRDCTIELKNVSFTYPGADEPTLQNLNLKIRQGEKLAVVGLNGAGKTTLVKLIAGLYDPTEGQILYGGQDVREFNRHEYYAMFTAVFQEFNILALSIADNIAQPLPEGERRDNDRIRECIQLAGLTEKIENLPDGIDTLLIKDVHLGAEELSGGETQRLMLARALYRATPIIILDEPTAALDPIAESDLYNKYNELSDGRTSVYISHRLASTRFCDRIILIDDKRIAEEGTHEALMRIDGKYKELFDIQSKYYQEVVAV